MTKAYSKISGYDRPHVYGRKYVGYVWTQAVFVKKNCVFTNFRIRVDDALMALFSSEILGISNSQPF